MAKLTGTTVLQHPESREFVVLTEGMDVPEWAGGLVGDHLLAEPKTESRTATAAKATK